MITVLFSYDYVYECHTEINDELSKAKLLFYE